MVRTTRAIWGVLLLLLIGGCGSWDNFYGGQASEEELDVLESADSDLVRITTRDGSILVPVDGRLPTLVRITTTSERQILLRNARVLRESIQGEEIDDIRGAPIGLSTVRLDSVALVEYRVSFDPSLWLLVGGFVLAGMAAKARTG